MRLYKFSVLLALSLLLGCGSDPEKPEPPPTFMSAVISASTTVNPDVDGRPSPVVVRIFELKSIGKYVEADFYSLFEQYDSALGGDLLGTEQIHLKPGGSHILKKREVSPETRFIAVAVAYRDIDRAVWRDSIEIAPGETTDLLVLADKLSVSLWKK